MPVITMMFFIQNILVVY